MYFSSELAAAYIATDQLELTCMQQRRQCSRLKEYGQGLEYKSHFRGQNSTITQQTIKLALLLSTMAEVQGTILRRGAMHHESQSTPTHILIT